MALGWMTKNRVAFEKTCELKAKVTVVTKHSAYKQMLGKKYTHKSTRRTKLKCYCLNKGKKVTTPNKIP